MWGGSGLFACAQSLGRPEPPMPVCYGPAWAPHTRLKQTPLEEGAVCSYRINSMRQGRCMCIKSELMVLRDFHVYVCVLNSFSAPNRQEYACILIVGIVVLLSTPGCHKEIPVHQILAHKLMFKWYRSLTKCGLNVTQISLTEVIAQMIRKQFSCVTDVCVIEINSQTIDVRNWRSHRKYLCKRPQYTKELLPEARCNRCAVQFGNKFPNNKRFVMGSQHPSPN